MGEILYAVFYKFAPWTFTLLVIVMIASFYIKPRRDKRPFNQPKDKLETLFRIRRKR